VPCGIYVRSSAQPSVGLIVDFRIPLSALPYIERRSQQNARDWYILKPIVAGPGDTVNTLGDWLVINGRRIAPMPPATDSRGLPLPIWRTSRILGPNEFFVFSNRIPNSFDSRCYGPIKRNQIESVRDSLLSW
jgi:type IV secretory pathway protease TraF